VDRRAAHLLRRRRGQGVARQDRRRSALENGI
jgi:hypothetical protein